MTAPPGSATIGRPIRIEGLVLPGTRLEPKPDPDHTAPLAIRIIDVAPHGTLLRYDLEITAWEPGPQDARRYLQRIDGSATDELPAIPVEAASVLPPGMPRVSTPEPVIPYGIGGYRELAALAAIVWLAGLVAIVFLLRKRGRRSPVPDSPSAATAADELARLLGRARAGELAPVELATIERLVYDAWRRELGLEATATKTLVERLRLDPRAVAAIDRLAAWLHAPARDAPEDVAAFVELLLPEPQQGQRGEPASEVLP